MATKTRNEIAADVIAGVLTGGNRTKAVDVRSILTNILDSYPNLKDGGQLFQKEVGYNSAISITEDSTFAHKKYVDDAIVGATGGILWEDSTSYLPIVSGVNGSNYITEMSASPLKVGGYYSIDLYGEITSSPGFPSAFTFIAKNQSNQSAAIGVYNTSDTLSAGSAYLNSFDSTGLNGTQLVSSIQNIELQKRSSVSGLISRVTVGVDTYIENVSGELYIVNPSSIPSGSPGILAVDSSNRVYSTTMPASGTVESISIASSNGFYGSSNGDPADPTIKIGTTVSGILKGNGSSVAAATSIDITAYLLTGLSITGSSITSTDSIIQAFGKIQNQLNAVLGGASYQGGWNATTNSPTLTSGSGTKGYYYVVSVAGSTTLDGYSEWKVGDWAIFNGTAWDKIDNTDAVSSVNGAIGAVTITVTGTSNRIDVSGGSGLTPTIDISNAYVGQSTITTLGTITTGTWNATIVSPTYGGTGVNNGSNTITVAGNLVTTGNFTTTFAASATATYTLPTATSTLLANNLGLSAGTTLIGGTGATGSIIFQDTSNSTNSLNTNHFIWKMTTSAGALEESLRMGNNGTGGEMNLYSLGNTSNYWLRSGSTFSYFNATTDLRLQIAQASAVIINSSSISMRLATTMFTAMKFTFAAGTSSVAPAAFQSGTNTTTAAAGNVEYNGTNLFFTRTGTTREYVLVGISGASAPATNTIGTIADYYGTSATRVLTTPNSWLSYVEGGTTYKIPLYT